MASGKQRRATFISQKLTFLKDQADNLVRAVGLYVNTIIATGESWTTGEDNKLEYLELCQIIDTAVDFLCEKCDELAGRSVGVAANEISQQPDLTSQSMTATTSTSATLSTPATSNRKTTGPLAPTMTTANRESAEPVQPADETKSKLILSRIAVIEEAMCSITNKAGTVVEEQKLLSKILELDKKHNSRVRKIKEQISEIIDTQNAINQQHKTRFHSLEQQLQKVSAAQERLKVEVESHTELSEKLTHVSGQLKSVKENIDILDARTGTIIDDCLQNHQVIEHVTHDLADKIMTNAHTIQVITEGQDQESTVLKELEIRLQALEADERAVMDVRKQAQKGEANFRILCQMLNDRLTPLEQLQTCLNQRASIGGENVKKLYQLIQEVEVMSPRLKQLEMSSSGGSCGFSAQAVFTGEVSENILRGYETKYSNVGYSFDADTGMFTAPVDGLYVASISLSLSENEEVQVDVKYKKGVGNSKGTCVCQSLAVMKHTTTCGVGVIGMKAGDRLFSSVYRMEKNKHSKVVSFSCFLLG